MICTRYREVARCLNIQLGDHAIFDHHRIPLATLAQAETRTVHGQAHCFCKGTVAVGQHGDVIRTSGLVPGAHDEGIINGSGDDFVHALRLQISGLFDEAGEVAGRAGGGESAGYREQRNLLACEIFAGLNLLRPFGGCLDHRYIGKLFTNRDRHRVIPFVNTHLA